MSKQARPSRGPAGLILTAAIVVLTLATAFVHLSLGGVLFLLNGLGYLGLAALIAMAYAEPHPLLARFGWFPRLALMAYAAATIVGYLIIGPYSTLGWLTKAVEVALIVLLVVDLMRVYGSPSAVVREAVASLISRT